MPKYLTLSSKKVKNNYIKKLRLFLFASRRFLLALIKQHTPIKKTIWKIVPNTIALKLLN